MKYFTFDIQPGQSHTTREYIEVANPGDIDEMYLLQRYHQ
jgi:hypothetical protein